VIFSACTTNNTVDVAVLNGSLNCDAEDIKNAWIYTNVPGVHCQGDFELDDSEKRSGDQSIKLTSEHPFGFALVLEGVSQKSQLVVSVWRKQGSGKANLTAFAGKSMLIKARLTGEVLAGWEELQLQFAWPDGAEISSVELQCVLGKDETEPAWFDDFSIQHKTSIFENLGQPNFEFETISLDLTDDALAKIEAKRAKALEMGILVQEDDDFVSVRFNETGVAKARLKGDWTDHLEGDKWSFRINLKKGEHWNGMRKFSLMTPEARGFMGECVLHKLYEQEGVLATSYEFVHLKFNGESRGVFAAEAHFSKELLASSGRPKGPILKFNEDPAWAMNLDSGAVEHQHFTTDAAEIEVYSSSKYLSDSAMYKQMVRGRNLLYAHQHNLLPADEIFDIERMASYVALIDVMQAKHDIRWSNSRFYYSPESGRLEPIGYDGCPAVVKVGELNIFGLTTLAAGSCKSKGLLNLFSNKEFVTAYLRQLKKFSSLEYLEAFFASVRDEHAGFEALLALEFFHSRFDTSTLFKHAERIRRELESFEDENKISVMLNKVLDVSMQLGLPQQPFPKVSVMAYVTVFDALHYEVNVESFYHKPITLLSFDSGRDREAFEDATPLPAYGRKSMPERRKVGASFRPTTVRFTVEGDTTVYQTPVSRYPIPRR
jgi:hypothetical protein